MRRCYYGRDAHCHGHSEHHYFDHYDHSDHHDHSDRCGRGYQSHHNHGHPGHGHLGHRVHHGRQALRPLDRYALRGHVHLEHAHYDRYGYYDHCAPAVTTGLTTMATWPL